MSLRGFIDRLRGRRLGRDESTDDWQPGDMAICIDARPWCDLITRKPVAGPVADDLRRVANVAIRFDHVFLKFEGDALNWWKASSFRKVRPQPPKACSQSFRKQMKDCRPKVDA